MILAFEAAGGLDLFSFESSQYDGQLRPGDDESLTISLNRLSFVFLDENYTCVTVSGYDTSIHARKSFLQHS